MKPDIQYARNGGAALAYQVVGDGPADILLVIGYTSNLAYAWEYPSMAAFLERLARGRRLILMDRRGSGLSDPFPPRQAPPLETLADDIRAVLDAAGSARTSLLGLWDGCLVATLFAATYPDRVSALVLFSANPYGTLDDETPWGWTPGQWEEWLNTIRQGWGTRAWVVANARWQAPSLMDDPEELERWIAFSRLSASPSSAEAVLRLETHTDIRPVLPAVRVPTLVLSRTGDQAQPPEGGRYIAERIPNARFIELPGDDALPWIGDVESVLIEIESFVSKRTGSSANSDRRLATVLFTDIVGSTDLLTELGDAAWRSRLAKHDDVTKHEIDRAAGRYVDSTGDGVLATFDGPAAAVRCAQRISEALGSLGIRIRAGVHTGELELDGTNVRGIAVHIGARVMSLAGPSEVLVSSTVRDLTAGSGLVFEDAGEHDLKGVPGRWHLYRALAEP
jgi:class 3 adenylate cyclase/alpha-beta hydrolase superfamily lysophospholipase